MYSCRLSIINVDVFKSCYNNDFIVMNRTSMFNIRLVNHEQNIRIIRMTILSYDYNLHISTHDHLSINIFNTKLV